MSRSGRTETAANGDRFIVLEQGRRYEGAPGDAAVPRHGVRPLCRAHRDCRRARSRRPTHKNLPHLGADHATRRNQNLGELLWRVGIPISALVLVLLAIPMSFVNPRAGRSVNLLFALLTYIVYSNLLSVSQARVAQGRMDFGVGWWLVHAGMVALLVVHVRAAHAADPPAAGPVSVARRAPWSATSRARSTARSAFVLLGFLAPVRLLRPDPRARRPRQGRLPPAPGVHLRAAVDADARLRAVPGGGADRHAVRAGAPRQQLRVHGDARLGPVAGARRRSRWRRSASRSWC